MNTGTALTNVALGILTRAAPQLNLFGIGFPITLGVGLLVIAMTLGVQNACLAALDTGDEFGTRGMTRMDARAVVRWT